jgi:gluconokinase
MSDPPPSPAFAPLVLVMMGVSGSGKTTVAALVAGRLGWAFDEGDSLHPQANVEKMAAGHPLDDADRAPWLARIAAWIAERLDAGECGVITCSALKRRYRELIGHRGQGVLFVFLDGTHDLIAQRLGARLGHFMPASLLDSQLETLEPPGPDEPAIRLDVGPPPPVIANTLIEVLVRMHRIAPALAGGPPPARPAQ